VRTIFSSPAGLFAVLYASRKHKIIAMNHFRATAEAENGKNVRG
jgi:hypothetical protein